MVLVASILFFLVAVETLKSLLNSTIHKKFLLDLKLSQLPVNGTFSKSGVAGKKCLRICKQQRRAGQLTPS